MHKGFKLIALLMLTAFLGACASDGSFVNPFESEPDTGNPFYYSEFSDIPIPKDMDEVRGDTVISFAPSGVKCGMQNFRGRLEAVALMNHMRRNMADQGWKLRSLTRAPQSSLVFEKSDRVVSLVIDDGMIFTTMRLFVSPRLEGDSASLDIASYPAASSGSSSSSGSSAGVQKLSQ